MDARTNDWQGFFSLIADQAQAASWRADAPADPPILHQGNSPVSFWTPQPIEQAARWLQARGYDAEPGHASYEHCRLMDGRALIVCYYSGSIVIQGPDTADALATLAALVRPRSDEGGR